MVRRILWVTAVLALAVGGTVGATLLLSPSNIDAVSKYSWSENTGWMNWRDAESAANGVHVHTDHLSGYIWMENVGFINVGKGAGPYANTNDTNFGVNIL